MGLKPAQETGRVARIDAGLGYIFRYDRSRSDDDVVANDHREDGRVAADGYMVPYACRFPQHGVASGRAAGGKEIVDEHHPMSYEAVVPDLDQLADEAVGLDLRVAAYARIALDLDKWSDEAVIPDAASVKVHGSDDQYVLPESDVVGYACVFESGAHSALAVE